MNFFIISMINFMGRNTVLQQTDRITRSVNSVYPHILESKTKGIIEKEIMYADFMSQKSRKLSELSLRNAVKLDFLRLGMSYGMELFKNIISALKNNKIANCYETARMAEIVAKINGQENVYPMKIYINRNKSGLEMKLGHVVSVITDKQIEPNQKYIFKNKDAIILDPWLGITEFAGKYTEKLKNDFGYHFDYMPDNTFNVNMIARQSKDLSEFKQKKKEKFFNPDITFLLHEDDLVTKSNADELRKLYPELILDNYKCVGLSVK